MSEFELIRLQAAWNGGYLITEDTGLVIKSTDEIDSEVAIFKDKAFVGFGSVGGNRNVFGSDYDHGHTIPWEAFDLNITMPPTGVGVTVRELIKQGYEVGVKAIAKARGEQ